MNREESIQAGIKKYWDKIPMDVRKKRMSKMGKAGGKNKWKGMLVKERIALIVKMNKARMAKKEI